MGNYFLRLCWLIMCFDSVMLQNIIYCCLGDFKMSRVRVDDAVVLKAMFEANGEKTIMQMADSLRMKENTLRTQFARIVKKLGENGKKVPGFKDGRSGDKSNVNSLLEICNSYTSKVIENQGE